MPDSTRETKHYNLVAASQAPKIIVVGPKLIFSFTVAQRLISFLERSWDPNAALHVAKGKAAA